MRRPSVRTDAEQRLSRLNRVAILDKNLSDRPAGVSGDLIEDLHGLNNADHCVVFDSGPDLNKDLILGAGSRIVCPDNRTLDFSQVAGRSRRCWRFRGCRWRRDLCRRRLRSCVCHGHLNSFVPTTTQTPLFAALTKIDLGQVVFFHQLDQLFELVEIE